MTDDAPKPSRFELTHAVAAYEVVFGVFGAVNTYVKGMNATASHGGGQVRVTSFMSVWSLLMTVFFAAMVFAGVQLWRRKRHGHWLSLAFVGAQVVQIVLPTFQFRIAAGLDLGFGISMVADGDAIVRMSAGFNYLIGALPLNEAPYVAINLVALVVFFYLVLKLFEPRSPTTPAPPTEPAPPAS